MKKIGLLFVLILSIVIVGGCKDSKVKTKDSIVGEWFYSGYKYTFNKDNTGSYTVGDTVMKFTYEDKDNKVSILYDGDTAASVFEYKIEGKKLIIKDSFGNDVTYEKK